MLVPNTTYGVSPKPNFTFDANTYTSSTALLDAMKTGAVEIGNLDPGTQLAQIPALEHDGFSVFGGPGWGWFGGFFNFKDTTDHFDKIIAQPYIRGVFAQLTDQSAHQGQSTTVGRCRPTGRSPRRRSRRSSRAT